MTATQPAVIVTRKTATIQPLQFEMEDNMTGVDTLAVVGDDEGMICLELPPPPFLAVFMTASLSTCRGVGSPYSKIPISDTDSNSVKK